MVDLRADCRISPGVRRKTSCSNRAGHIDTAPRSISRWWARKSAACSLSSRSGACVLFIRSRQASNRSAAGRSSLWNTNSCNISFTHSTDIQAQDREAPVRCRPSERVPVTARRPSGSCRTRSRRDLGVTRCEIRVHRVTEHLTPEVRQGARVGAVERNIANEGRHERPA
jgi:hypothetical protein